MADLKTLSEEMEKLKRQIKTVLTIASYPEYDDLSALSDYNEIRTADARQQLEEYRNILDKLDRIHSTLSYYDRPIREVSRIYRNETGRYETDRGYYFTSGSSIEFLRVEQVYNEETDAWEDAEIWTSSRVEHNGNDYYLVGFPDVELSGLKVRVRG